VYTSETIAEQFGVVKASYEAVPLQQRSVLAAVCRGPGNPKERLEMVAQQLPTELVRDRHAHLCTFVRMLCITVL
jgi:hypothetical protein